MAQQAVSNNSTIAVIGAGNMGSGIGQKYAAHGHNVIMIDKEQANLAKSRQGISQSLEQAVQRNIFTSEEADQQKARMSFTTDLACAKNANLVIEAIFEDLAIKRELFRLLDALCSKDVVLATNTSSLKVADLIVGLAHPERVLGLHYFYPPSKNRLVEIISTDHTDSAAAARAKDWQISINKTVIHSKDSPGFIVNRFFVPWLNESMRIVHEGEATIATVERAAQTFFEIGMGPFALMNATGLPITYHSCEALARALGTFYAPCPLILPRIEQRAAWEISGTIDESALQKIALRLLTVVAAVGCQMVAHDAVCTVEDANCGAKVGLLWKKGPFELLTQHHRDVALTVNKMKLSKKGLPDTAALESYQAEM